MTKYTKSDIGKVLVPITEGLEPTEFMWNVVTFAKSLGYQDEGVDYTEDNYGIGERGFVDNEEWAEARVAYGEAIDYISEFCENDVTIETDENGLSIVINQYSNLFGE